MSAPRPSQAESILASLGAVEGERQCRAAAPELAGRVQAVKAYQQARFRLTHADLLASERYAAVAHFFLDELYGPGDFGTRDAQFARIVPALVRLFPPEIVATVGNLAALHALSEALDTQIARALPDLPVNASAYIAAWRRTDRAADRRRQVELVLAVGTALDRYTRKPMLMASLRLMRAPARAAGLSELQAFLERGFDTFRGMGGAAEFLDQIAERERALADRLFDPDVTSATLSGQLP